MPQFEAEILKVQDMAEACRLHAGNAMWSTQEALGSQAAAHESALAAVLSAAWRSGADTQLAGPSSHTCTAQFTPGLQVQIELLNPQMKEINNTLQTAINSVAEMATDSLRLWAREFRTWKIHFLGKPGHPKVEVRDWVTCT